MQNNNNIFLNISKNQCSKINFSKLEKANAKYNWYNVTENVVVVSFDQTTNVK